MRYAIAIPIIITALVMLLLIGSSEAPDVETEKRAAFDPDGTNIQPAQIASSAIAQAVVEISDGQAITITWYEPPYRYFPLPNGSQTENYEYYKAQAEAGVGIAAYHLANMMSSCSSTFLTQAELDAAVVQMGETRTVYDPALQADVRIAQSEDIDKHIEGAIAHFENCRDFSAEQRGKHEEWLELAASNGFTLAMIEYGRKLDDPVTAVELYRSAWNHGDANALLSLATGLEKVYNQGIDPQAKISSYAAMHAFVTLLRAAHGADPAHVIGRWTLRNQAKLDEMTKQMLPHELVTALEMSKLLIASNRNCCFAM